MKYTQLEPKNIRSLHHAIAAYREQTMSKPTFMVVSMKNFYAAAMFVQSKTMATPPNPEMENGIYIDGCRIISSPQVEETECLMYRV